MSFQQIFWHSAFEKVFYLFLFEKVFFLFFYGEIETVTWQSFFITYLITLYVHFTVCLNTVKTLCLIWNVFFFKIEVNIIGKKYIVIYIFSSITWISDRKLNQHKNAFCLFYPSLCIWVCVECVLCFIWFFFFCFYFWWYYF